MRRSVLLLGLVFLAAAPTGQARLDRASADIVGSITPGGPPVTVTISTSGDNARLNFTGTAGQRVSVRVTNVSLSSHYEVVSVRDPSNVVLQGSGAVTSSGWVETVTLPVNGTYSVYIDPASTATGSSTQQLYDVPADVSAPVVIGGAPVRVEVGTPGQKALLPFAGTAGQDVRIYRSDYTLTNSIVRILKPDGSQLASTGILGSSNSLLAAELPSSGTYSIEVDGHLHHVGSMTVTLRIYGDSPIDGAQIECGVPVLRAEPVSAATAYQFQVASDSGFSSVVSDSGSLKGTNTYAVPVEDVGGASSYWWRWKTSTGSWSAARVFTQRPPMLGARDYWPIWSHGPLAVNQANGNLVVALPGPSYPTAVGSLGASLSYNSLDSANRGFGAGWALSAGNDELNPPVELVDHNLLVGTEQYDAVEVISADGSSTCFTHVGETNTYIGEPGDGSLLAENQDGTWTLTDVDGAIYGFGVPDGATGTARLASVEYADASAGNGKLSYAFSTQDPSKLTSITDVSSGRALTFTWNSLDASGCANAIVCIAGPDGVTWRFVGDGSGGTSGRLARVHNGTRDLFAVSYDASGRVNELQNANDLNPTAASPGYDGDHSLTVGYDGNGKVASVGDGPITNQTPTTSTWTFAYTSGNVSTTATRSAHPGLAAGTVRTAAGYTTGTPPRQQGQPTPKSTKTYYDPRGHPIEVVDLLGNKTMAGYSARDQLLWTEDEEGNPTDYAYDSVNDVLLTVTGPDPDGAGPLDRPITLNRYDETQIGTSGTPGEALQGLRAEYFDNINLAGRPEARRTDATVDFNWGSGGPSVLGGTSDNFSIRWSGNLNVSTAGVYTFSTVSDEGTRLTVKGLQVIDNWKDQTVTTKTTTGITLTAGLHKLTLEYYDKTGPAEAHLRWSCTTCSPSISDQIVPATALRPAWLNQTSTVSPLGRIDFSHYADPATGRADYTLAKLDNGTNLITSFAYETFGRVTQKVMPKGNSGRTIDSQGDLGGSPNLTYATTWTYYGPTETATTPSACGTSASINQAGLLKTTATHGLADLTTVYTAAGLPTAVTNGRGTRTRCYDAEARLTEEQAPGDTQATTYTYDPAGAQRTAQDASGTVTTEYDEAGRPVRTVDSFGAEATFAYDTEGNLTSRTAAAGPLTTNPNYVTTYAYDELGQTTSVTDPAARVYSFAYDTRGNLRTTQHPNVTFAWSEYNAAGWLTAHHNRHGTLSTPLPSSVPSDASPLADYAYTYDLEGRRTQQVRTGGGLTTETTGYTYDELGRMKQVMLPGGVTRTYSFDLDSNRTAIAENGQTVATYAYNPNDAPGVDQLTSVIEGGQTRTFAYSTDGETTERGTDTLDWDGWGRHSGGTFSGTTISYGFDATGFRRSRTSAGTTVRQLLGGLFETTGSGTITLTEIGGPAGDLAHYAGPPTTSSTAAFRYYDGHGDLAAEAGSSGNRTAAYTYDPFGAALQTPPATTLTERWTGRWDKKLDTTSNLIEMGARPYDPVLGRFLSVDPVEGGSFNNYDYANQDPVNAYDLDGRCPVCIRIGHALWRLIKGAGKKGPKARGTLVPSQRTIAHYQRQLAEHGVRSLLKSARSELSEINRHLVALYQAQQTGARTDAILRDLEKHVKALRGIKLVLERHFGRRRSGR